MQDLCPICLKNGLKKKVKLLQINLQEGVRVCEEEKCIWPFGYEDFVICQRVVGKIWSCYWDDYKSTPKLKEAVATSAKPALYSIPTTSKDTSNKCISSSILDTKHLKSIDNINNTSNTIETKACDLQTLDDKESYILLHKNNTEHCNTDNNILSKEATICSNINANNLQLFNSNTKNIKIENEFINSVDSHIKDDKDFCTKNIQCNSNVRGIPKIRSIEKTSIDISNVITKNQNSTHEDLDKKVLTVNKSADSAEEKLISLTNGNNLIESEKLVNSEPSENIQHNNEVAITKSNLSITMMEIDGLPPITLSFEIPASTTIPKTVTSSIQQTDYKINTTEGIVNTKSNISEVKSISRIRNVTSGKHYAKFSFSAIKKKIDSNNSINTNNNSTDSINMKLNPAIKDVEKSDFTNCAKNGISNENFMSNNSNNSGIISNLSSQENITSSEINTSVNIDTVLEDFLSSDYSVSEDINDEWINSLLS
ncbi:myb-like protein D [Colletes gigas]|uniref:myb-like protein D n=1 Tax=Colletes gigas TaxID=935657 RepID=UPI001C9A2D38|nr:myb-like protein D [Colletes gigas]